MPGTFTYGMGSNPPIDYPRLLISDTQEFLPDGTTPGYVFSDQEITSMTNIVAGACWQSGMFFSGTLGSQTLPSLPVPYYRIAAMLLMAVASNKARLASIKQMLDVKLDSSDAAIQLRATAQGYLDQEDNCGSFAIIEQVNDVFSFRDRFWKTVQREQTVGV